MDLLMNRNLIKKNLSPTKSSKLISLKDKNKDFNAITSPDEKCPICLVVPIEDKSLAGTCHHSFCKVCLLEWCKVSGIYFYLNVININVFHFA